MLQTDDRILLREAIRPPDGYELDEGIITTYSLDLLSLLTVPLFFTLFETEEEDGSGTPDPLALLQALRRHAARLTVFSQAGEIAVPARKQQLYGYLESSIVEVRSPMSGGIFHPKVWALRYVARDEPVVYRLACFSRNLTSDRSWDTSVILEGKLREGRKVGFGPNRPLGEFFAALPSMAIRDLAPGTADRAARFSDELRRVEFDIPDGFESYAFWPLGHDRRRPAPFTFTERATRGLIISPFVSGSALSELADIATDVRLVSRADELDTIDTQTLGGFSAVSVLADAVESEQAGEAAGSGVLSGLHAKVYVVDHGWSASVFTGSANATRAAFECNVEFLLQLTGKRSNCGVDAVLGGGKTQNGLGALLQSYHRIAEEPSPDSLQKQLESETDQATRSIATQSLGLVAQAQTSDTYRLEIRRMGGGFSSDSLDVRCWPITLTEEQAVPFHAEGGIAAVFTDVSAEALTTFLAVSVTASRDGESVTKRFVLNLPLEGGPADRRERILRTVLRDRQRVLRFLLLLLGDLDALVTGDVPLPGEDTTQDGSGRHGEPVTLLEPIVRALHRDPERLDQIARLVEELRTGDGEDLLPEDFGPIWEIVWAARQGARK